jgi:hypothetical protein
LDQLGDLMPPDGRVAVSKDQDALARLALLVLLKQNKVSARTLQKHHRNSTLYNHMTCSPLIGVSLVLLYLESLGQRPPHRPDSLGYNGTAAMKYPGHQFKSYPQLRIQHSVHVS